MFEKRPVQMAYVAALSAALVALAWAALRFGKIYGAWVLAMTAVPVAGAAFARLDLKRLLPDIIFGAIDTGLLTVGALVGATAFGLIGAIVGGVVGDAITDAVAGFFEGSVAEWLRSKGIDESRTALGSACGKMAGCLAGSGLVLTAAALLGIAAAR